MNNISSLASGLAGAIGSSLRVTQNQLLFVEFGGKLSRLDLMPHATLVSSGTTVLKGTFPFDLDTGAQGGVGAGHDIWWEQQTQVKRQMVPQNAATLVNLGATNFAALNAASLQMLSYSTAPIPGSNDATNKLVVGDVFAVRTSQGNFAKVKVTSYGYDLGIQWVTYRLDPAYAVIGTGFNQPEDVEVSADNAHAYVTERGGTLVRVALANANRAEADFIVSGMAAPQQIALDEAHNAAYVVEYAVNGHLWRIDLVTRNRTAVVANLQNAVGLVLSADRQSAYVSEQGAGGRVSRIDLASGAATLLATGLTAPFMLAWADESETSLLVAERDPANRITRISLTGDGASPVVASLPARPSSVAVMAPGRLLVCSDSVIARVDFASVIFQPSGPLLMAIGFVPFDKIDKGTGLATTDAGSSYLVKQAPFGGTLPLMINHQRAANDGASYFQVKIDGALRSDTWVADYWDGTQTVHKTTGPINVAGLPDFYPVHAISELFLWTSPALGMQMDTRNLANGLRTITVDFFDGLGAYKESSPPLTIMINNQACVAVLTAPTLGGGVSSDPCGLLRYADTSAHVTLGFTASHPANYGSWGINVIKGASGALSQGGPLPPTVTALSPTVAQLLGTCTLAGFAEYLSVATTIQNGWGRQSQYDASAALAFVLAP